MRVTFVLWNLKLTGGNRVNLKVADGLVERGHDVNIIALDGKSPFPTKANIHTRKEIRASWEPLNLINLPELTRRMPTSDVTVATFCPTAYPVYLRGDGVLFYYIQHYETLFFTNPLPRFFADATYRLPLNWIVNSTWLKGTLKMRFNKDGFVIHPGVDLATFYPREVERRQTKRLVCLGKSAPIKGLQDAFKAIKIVAKKRPDIKLELILYGSEPSLKAYPPIECNHIYKPSDDELAELYSSADVVLMPSWYESFPLPPLEAMACGAPVVTTRYGTEDYAFHEQNALVVPPRDQQKMAEAILRVVSDEELAAKLRSAGVKTAKEFTWEKTVNKVEALFKRTLEA